jgi:hypothetical protein
VFIPNNQLHPKACPFHVSDPTKYCLWTKVIAQKPIPRMGAVFLRQENPKQKKDKAHQESLIEKTNH